MSRALRQTFVAGSLVVEADLRVGAGGRLRGSVVVDEEALDLDVAVRRLDGPRLVIEHADRSVRATVVRAGDVAWVAIEGRTYEVRIEEPGAGAAHHVGEEDFAVSPMTGTLVKVSVEPGADVPEGGELFVVEAMKMEYVVKAPRAVTVADVRHGVGEQVDQGRVVITFEVAP